MNYLAVAPAWNQHSTAVSGTSNNSATPSPASYLGGAAILLVLALMLAVGFNAAGLLPRRNRRQSRPHASRQRLVH